MRINETTIMIMCRLHDVCYSYKVLSLKNKTHCRPKHINKSDGFKRTRIARIEPWLFASNLFENIIRLKSNINTLT